MPRSYDSRRFPSGPYTEPTFTKTMRGPKRIGPIGEIVAGDDIEVARWIARHRYPRQRPVPGIYKVKFTPDAYYATADPTVGTPWVITIDEDLAGWQLYSVELSCSTVATVGSTIVQLRNEHDDTTLVDTDMLTTEIQIDVGEYHAKDSAVEYLIDLAKNEVEWGDRINIDLDQVGTNIRGLELTLFFCPS